MIATEFNQLLFSLFCAIFEGEMKKLFTVVILLIYFTVSTGFVVSMHYCMNEFDSASIGETGDNECDRCGMETDGSCCWDDVKVVKLQFQHTIAKLVQAQFSTPATEAATASVFDISAISELTPKKYFVAHSPPLGKQDTYLFNCVFRI